MPGVFILLFLLVPAIIVVVIVVALKQGKATNEAWGRVASRLNLQFKPGSGFGHRSLRGTLGGCPVLAETYTHGSGKNSSTRTRFRVTHPRPLPAGLRLTQQGMFSGISKFFGSQDIEVGDTQFDDNVVVKGRSPQEVIDFLTPARRLRIHHLLRSHGSAVIDDERIEWSRNGVIRDPKQLHTTLAYLVGVSGALAGTEEDDAPLSKAIHAREAGDLDGALGHLGEARRRRAEKRIQPPALPALPRKDATFASSPDTEPDADVVPGPVDEDLLEAEILYVGGKHEEARKAFDDVKAKLPEDPEVSAWAAQAQRAARAEQAEKAAQAAQAAGTTDAARAADVEPTAETEPTAPPEPTPQTEEGGALGGALGGVASDDLCRALFVDVTSSIEANRIFEETYQGQTVEWEGTLTSVDDFTFDFVLGHEGGTKALFDVYAMEGGFVGGKTVVAVVGLPKGSAKALADYKGKRLTFRGRLVRVDTFMRNVYLKEGRCEPPAGGGSS